MKILITGGAGFVGSQLALAFKRDAAVKVTILDNLKRRGSELNLELFKKHNINFVHGDIRNSEDLKSLDGTYDVMIEASAEASVLAGLSGDPNYLLNSNLFGALRCLEFSRKRVKAFIFLSTSRVYSIDPLRQINLRETETRLQLSDNQPTPGASADGISETFPTGTSRSLYGTSKLCAEYLIQEYHAFYGLKAVINRCGVLCGPGQFGRVDQGVFTLWIAHHFFKLPLVYKGFGGTGKQVRDLLHPLDLYELIKRQISNIDRLSGQTFNVGGGPGNSTSLLELTQLARKITGYATSISADPGTNPVDIPSYISDTTLVKNAYAWSPQIQLTDIFNGIFNWLKDNESKLAHLFLESPQ